MHRVRTVRSSGLVFWHKGFVCKRCTIFRARPGHAHSTVPVTPLSLSPYSLLCLVHTVKPTGVAVAQCISWSQTQQILIACQIRYHSHLWDLRRIGQL